MQTHDIMWTNPCKLGTSHNKLHDSISMICTEYKYTERKMAAGAGGQEMERVG